MPQKHGSEKSSRKKPRKYLRAAMLSAAFAAVALPSSAQAQSYSPAETDINREMNSAATGFKYSYRNPSEWPLRRLESCTHTTTTTPRISSDITVNETVYDHSSLTRADLDDKTNNHSPEMFMPLGTTGGTYNYSVAVRGTTYRNSGQDCLHLTSVDIDVTFSQQIHTASELLDYSCHLAEVIEHEELHTMFNKTAIQNYGAVIEDLIAGNVKNVNKRVIPQGKTANDVLSEMQLLFSSTVSDTLEAAMDKADAKHSRIDTLSNYAQEQKEMEAKCGSSLPRFPHRQN